MCMEHPFLLNKCMRVTECEAKAGDRSCAPMDKNPE